VRQLRGDAERIRCQRRAMPWLNLGGLGGTAVAHLFERAE